MNELDISKQNIVDKFEKMMSVLFSSELFYKLTDLKKEIKEEEDKILNLKLEHSNLIKEGKRVLVEQKGKESYLKNFEFSLKDREDVITKKEFSINEKINLSELEVSKKLKIKNDLIKSINEMGQLSKEVDDLKANKTLLSDDISTLKKQIKHLNDSMNEAMKDRELINLSILDSKNKAESDLKVIKDQISEQLKIVLPTMNELNDRKKEIDEKEKSLEIVIDRWKRLYEEKGVGFRV